MPRPVAKGARGRGTLPAFVAPITARTALGVPTGTYRYEIKLDGFRALGLLGEQGQVELVSRNEVDFATRFPEIVEALASFPVRDAILDGEVVALAPDGRSSFALLGDRARDGGRAPLVFYVFDVLRWQGTDVTHLPLEDRKRLLAAAFALGVDPRIRFSDSLSTDAAVLLAEARRLGLEGLVGKRAGSVYETGRRSDAWIKLKLVAEQELVIGGYTEPERGRSTLGALVVGTYADGKLYHAGSVGSGFGDDMLRELGRLLTPLAQDACPFADLPAPPDGGPRRMTRSEMARCHWVEPRLVCQVRFTAWTPDGHLRHPVFLGLRPDKNALEVVREPCA